MWKVNLPQVIVYEALKLFTCQQAYVNLQTYLQVPIIWSVLGKLHGATEMDKDESASYLVGESGGQMEHFIMIWKWTRWGASSRGFLMVTFEPSLEGRTSL